PTPPHQTSAICGHRTEAESPNRSFSLGAVTTNARRRRPNSDPTGSGTTQLGHASDQRALDTLPMTRQAPSLRPSRRDNGGAPRPLCPSEPQAPQPPTQRWSAETTVRAQWSRRSVVVSSWQLRNSGCMAGLSPSPDTPVLVPRIV